MLGYLVSVALWTLARFKINVRHLLLEKFSTADKNGSLNSTQKSNHNLTNQSVALLLGTEAIHVLMNSFIICLLFLLMGEDAPIYLHSIVIQCTVAVNVDILSSSHLVSFAILGMNTLITLFMMLYMNMPPMVIGIVVGVLLIVKLGMISVVSYMKQIAFSEMASEKQQVLMKSERLYKRLYDDAPSLFMSISKQGRILNVNRAVMKLIGPKFSAALSGEREHGDGKVALTDNSAAVAASAAATAVDGVDCGAANHQENAELCNNQLIGLNIEDLFMDSCRQRLKDIFDREEQHEEEMQQVELEMMSYDGTIHHMLATITATTFDSKDPDSWYSLMILHDLSEKKNLQSHLEEAKERAEEASRAKSAFLNHMSHEIRTPLCSIFAHVELLLSEGGLNDDQLDTVTSIQSSSLLLRNLISDVLDVAKIEAGKLILESSEFNVQSSVQTVQRVMKSIADSKNLKFTVRTKETLRHATFLGDNMRLNQILINLIGNAIKFTNEGSVEVTITDSTNDLTGAVRETVKEFDRNHPALPHERRLIFIVKDTGRGIHEDRMDMLFQQFTQVHDNTEYDSLGGTGLGLTISKSLIEMMRGQVFVESKFKEGSTFYFTAILSEVRSDNNNSNSPSEDLVLVDSTEAQHLRVLVAEDNLVNQKILYRILKHYGVGTVAFANNGSVAVEQFKKSVETGETFDLIFMDIFMPIMSGYEATRLIREMDPEVIIIGLSANASSAARLESVESGMTTFCSKPFTMQQIASFLRRKLHARRNSVCIA